MGKYDDIIHLERPKSAHPAMPVSDRAKIFLPFAALRGYEEILEEKQKSVQEKFKQTHKK